MSVIDLRGATPAEVSPHGEVAKGFGIPSNLTDIQRDVMKEKLQGRVVQWTLEVWNVSKGRHGIVTIESPSTSDTVGVFCRVTPRGMTFSLQN